MANEQCKAGPELVAKAWVLLDELEKVRGAPVGDCDWRALNKADDELRVVLDGIDDAPAGEYPALPHPALPHPARPGDPKSPHPAAQKSYWTECQIYEAIDADRAMRAQAAPAAVAGPSDRELLAEWDRVSTIAKAGERRLAVMRAVLAKWGAAPTTQAAPQPAAQHGDDFWPVDGSASRKQLIAQIGQMNFRLTALRQENAGPVARAQGQAEALRNYQTAAAHAAQGDAEDAARYRRIRRGQHWSVIDGIGNELRAEALDAAIDAARAHAKEGSPK